MSEYSDLLDEITAALGENGRLAAELDDIVGRRLVEAEDAGCSPRIIAAEQRLERMECELERLRAVVEMVGAVAAGA